MTALLAGRLLIISYFPLFTVLYLGYWNLQGTRIENLPLMRTKTCADFLPCRSCAQVSESAVHTVRVDRTVKQTFSYFNGKSS